MKIFIKFLSIPSLFGITIFHFGILIGIGTLFATMILIAWHMDKYRNVSMDQNIIEEHFLEDINL